MGNSLVLALGFLESGEDILGGEGFTDSST